MELSDVPVVDQRKRHPTRVLVAAALGNAFEWFDFVIYGYLAVTLSRVFFPAHDSGVALMLTLATFAVGFIMRPLGGVLIGLYADVVGRRSALTMTIWLMAIATGMIGLAPTYAMVGILAPIVVLFARLLQGLAASGEYGSAVALLVESAPQDRKAFYVAWQMASTLLAIVFAGIIGLAGTHLLTPVQLEAWGWRIPFLIGLLIAPVGYYIRREIEETLSPSELDSASWRQNVAGLCRSQWPQLTAALALLTMGAGNFYVTFIYMPTFAVRELGLGLYAPFLSTTVAGLISAFGAISWASLVDRGVSARWLLGSAALLLAIIAYPLYAWVIHAPSLGVLVLVQATLALPGSAIVGLVTVVCAELFPARVRASVLGVSYNITNTLFGGLAPLLVSWFVVSTGDKAGAAYYVIAMALCGLAGIGILARRVMRQPQPGFAS
jgi:MHS family proline/betaine transporter-like MFS transporter